VNTCPNCHHAADCICWTGTWLDIYEARWHGFARWEMSLTLPIQGKPKIAERRVLASGWARKHRGLSYRRYRLVEA
jgi:hypothetical protein